MRAVHRGKSLHYCGVLLDGWSTTVVTKSELLSLPAPRGIKNISTQVSVQKKSAYVFGFSFLRGDMTIQ